ncbi:MAG: hypothetical protein P4L85_02010 [Paludisphaera borealis]|uniref:hypothetical protein n=1 Tax=Paludisphaera borealis TaxID=1387353 RepID=UPI0028490E52|nr:hypothetical protein [Paludisphaera borealis]MDR3618096.1 hypothetical protein [Paludisphaera borealis]
MAMGRKTLGLTTTAWLVIAGIGLGQAPAKKDELAPAELRKAMTKAHEIRARISKLEEQGARGAAEQEFQKLVVGCRESFPEIEAAVGGKARYARFTLNSRGGGFDAVRFNVPTAGRTYQLFWSLAIPGSIKTQNIELISIIEVGGDAMGFTYPEVKEDVTIPGLNLPEPNWWSHYRLYGRKLQAGREYLLWFDFKTDQPLPIYLRLRIEPIETTEPPHTPALQTARRTFQEVLEKLNARYDADSKAARRKYLGELEGAGKAIAKKNAASRTQLVAEADRANLGDSAASDPRGFRIIRAEIGVGDRWNDVTTQARGFVRGNRLKVASPEYDFQPDAAYGVEKTLIIVYAVDGKPGVYTAPADRNVDLPPPVVTTPAKK